MANSESIGEIIYYRIKKIDRLINLLKSLVVAQREGIPTKKVESDLFLAEIRLYPVGDDNIKAIIRIEPKVTLPQDLLSLIYLTELLSQDEETLFKNAVEARHKKMIIGGVIHLSAIVNKNLIKTEIKRILTKVKRAFKALLDDNIRSKVIKEKNRLESLIKSPTENKRDILITIMRLNEILLYEAPLD